jgi:hypothetical protein
MEQYRNDPSVEGLLFSYIHFYGSYRFIGNSRRWYRREIRIVRPDQAIQSWGDAQGFRKHGKKLHVKLIPAHIYHYGWVKPPNIQQLKQQHFNKYWHSDAWMKSNIPEIAEYDYNNGGKLAPFTGTHPSVMHDRVANAFWNFAYHPEKIRQSTKERLLENVERWTGWRIGEYKNYIKL